MSTYLHLVPALQRLLPALAQWRALYRAAAEVKWRILENMTINTRKLLQTACTAPQNCRKLSGATGDLPYRDNYNSPGALSARSA